MNSDTRNRSGFWMAWVRRTSASERLTSALNPVRLRWSTAPVLPATPTFPVLSTSNASIAGVDQVPQFVRQEPEALGPARGLSIDAGLIPFAPVLGDGARDGIVQAPVQRAEVVRA